MQILIATTQSADMMGEAKADRARPPNGLTEFAKARGVTGFPVAVSLNSIEGSVFVAVYATDVGTNFDEIEDYAKSNGGVVPTKRFRIEGARLSDFLDLFKRFNVVLRVRMDSMKKIEYESE